MFRSKKEKPPKEKKEKKPKAKKEKKEKKPKDPNKKKSPMKLIVLLLAVAVVAGAAFFLLKPKEEGEKKPKLPELPAAYQVGNQSILAFTPGEEESESPILATKAKTITYTYDGLKNAAEAAHAYVVELASRDQGYLVVNDDLMRQAPPEFDTPEGTIYMVKVITPEQPEEEPKEDGSQTEDGSASSSASQSQPDASQEEEPDDQMLSVRITWSEGRCVVTADEVWGKITMPNQPQDDTNRPHRGGSTMTSTSSMDYLYSLPPEKLGLEGDSMEDYQIIPMDGTRMVDGHMCFQLNVYESNSLGSNEFAGIFMMSVDGQYLYNLDMDTGTATLVER